MKRIAFFLLVLGFISCKKDIIDNKVITETTWELTYVRSTDDNSKITFPRKADNTITIRFNRDSNKLEFSGICNGGGGDFAFGSKLNMIAIYNLSTTEIYCRYFEWEEYTTENLKEAYKYEITGNELTIYSEGEYNLYFKGKN